MHVSLLQMMLGGPDVDLDSFPKSGNRFVVAEEFGQGAFGRVFAAQDEEAKGKKVAIKILKKEKENDEFTKREFVVLRDLCQHPNLVEFYGGFECKDMNEIWFVLEVCMCIFVYGIQPLLIN